MYYEKNIFKLHIHIQNKPISSAVIVRWTLGSEQRKDTVQDY